MDIARQIQAAYDQMVFEYAKRNHAKMAESLVDLAHELLEHVGQAGQILEVGCGTGRDMAWFESQHGSVIGIDLSTGMLRYARNKVQGSLVSMDMCHLGFPHEYFEGAWCCASLLHVPKAQATDALQEIRRILKPGGMLVLSVQKGEGEEWEDSYVPGVRRFFARYQPEEMRALLSQPGFSLRKINSSQAAGREWLSFVCITE